jgi:ABC-type dipeptide/oligopeptide/nickel transport system permease component
MTATYLTRRFVIAVLTALAASSIIFLMVHLIPGDPVVSLLGDFYSETAAANLRRQLGLDLPLWEQYVRFFQRLLTGDMGTSFITRQPVFAEVVAGFGHTLRLALGGLLVSTVIGVPLGVAAAVYRGKAIDWIAMNVAILGVSMPSFWLGILLMLAFSVHLGWLPLLGAGRPGDAASTVVHLILPSLTLGLRSAGLTARVTRSAMLEVLGQDYVRTARAIGASRWRVIHAHAFRNALLTVVTVVGLDLGRMLGGTTIVEVLFSRPGTGLLLIQGVLNRDYPLIQGAFLIYLIAIIVTNFLVDLLYARLDPRVVYS